jgi:ATP-dependent helicase HrpA
LRAEGAPLEGSLDPSPWCRDGITSWDFGHLPELVELPRAGLTLVGYPAIVDRGETVSLRLVNSSQTALWQTRCGLRRLFVLSTARDLERHVEWLPNLRQILLQASPIANFRRQIAELIAKRALFGPLAVADVALGEEDDSGDLPRSAEAFTARVTAARQRLTLAVQDVLPLITMFCEAYHRLRPVLEQLRPPSLQYATDDVAGQMAELVAPDFLTTTPWACLQAYPRYFRAIELRFEKLSQGGTVRDREQYELIAKRWRQYLGIARSHRDQGILDPALTEYRWLLEEYRVSLFAQSLGTRVPVSEQRLEAAWRAING